MSALSHSLGPMNWPNATPPGTHMPGTHAPGTGGSWGGERPYDPRYAPLHAVPNPTGRPMIRRWLLGGIIVVGFALLASVFAATFNASFGVRVSLFAVLLSAVPLGIVIPVFLWLDRFEAEPTRYLLTAFGWGALGAAFFAGVLNTTAQIVLGASGDESAAGAVTAVIVAPITEESFKGLFLVLLLIVGRRELNGLTDAIVYAGIVAAGFAFTENILYLGQAYTDFGSEALLQTFVLRGIASPFIHPLFTVMTGIGIGIALSTRSILVRIVAPITGWCLAVLMHGLWNLSAIAGPGSFALAYVVGLAVLVSFMAFVVWVRAREGRLIAVHLQPYVDTGWLSVGEVVMLSSMRQRREARTWAKFNGGERGLETMQAFQDTATELALLRARMHLRSADPASLECERRLLDSMTVRRRQLAGTSLR